MSKNQVVFLLGHSVLNNSTFIVNVNNGHVVI